MENVNQYLGHLFFFGCFLQGGFNLCLALFFHLAKMSHHGSKTDMVIGQVGGASVSVFFQLVAVNIWIPNDSVFRLE